MSIEITTLDNGIRIATERLDAVLSASVGIWIDRGGRHETPAQNGVAHFLEHMAFKGTSTRSAADIANEIETVGGLLNAYTAKENTAYYARVLGQDVPLALDILSDILVNPSFEAREIEVERGVILQEIGQSKDSPDDIIFDWLQETIYPDQAIGRTILGSEERVSNFVAHDFQSFIAENYGGENMIVSAVGDVEHDAVVAALRPRLETLNYKAAREQHRPKFVAGEKRVEKSLEQAHIAMAFEAPALRSDEFYTAHVYSILLGGGMSSRLFQKIREQMGLCYTIFSSYSALEDAGQLILYSGTSGESVDDVLRSAVDEMINTSRAIDDAELARAKAQIRAGSVMSLENSFARAERMARNLALYQKVRPLEEIIEKIDAVTAKDITNFAAQLIEEANLGLTLYGPLESGMALRDVEAQMGRG